MGVGRGGAEGAAAPPTFGTGEQTIALAPPKVEPFALRCLTESNGLRQSFAAPWNIQEPKSFQLQGALPPNPPPGALPLDLAGGSAPRPLLQARAPRARHGPGHCLLPQLPNTSNVHGE